MFVTIYAEGLDKHRVVNVLSVKQVLQGQDSLSTKQGLQSLSTGLCKQNFKH